MCNLRGGALKLTTSGRWAHIVCAMAIPEVLFEDVKAREPINIEKISPARLKLVRVGKLLVFKNMINRTQIDSACL